MKKVLLIFAVLLHGIIYGEASQQEKLTEYLSALVSMPSETANSAENDKALRWLEKQLPFPGLNFSYQTFEGHHTLVVTTQKTKTPDIFLVAHIDVVPAAKELYKPRMEGGKMYGRGAYDMKMAIACYLLLFQELEHQLKELNIGLMFTSDEEVGGMNGVKRLLEAGYASKVALLPDGGFDWHFEEAAKGVLQVKITAQGKSAHSSRPWLGENAIEILTGALGQVQAHFEKEKVRFGDYFPTANVGIIQGGKAPNQVPDLAEAKIDIRYPPAMKGGEIFAELQKLFQKDPRISINIIAEGSPHQVDLQQLPFVRFRNIAKQMYGIEVGKIYSYGASDARFFGERDIPVLVIAPKGGDIHSDNEFVDLADLTRFYNVMKKWVLEMD